MLDCRVRAFLLALYLAALGLTFAHGAVRGVTLHGKLYVVPETDCTFSLEPEGDSEGITAITLGGYLCDYFAGSTAQRMTVTITPEGK